MDNLFLVKLCSRAWSLPALAAIAQGVPARVSPLAAALGSGRTAMGSAVAQLLELGLLETNPGFGHPLRPEFRLTPSGQGLAR
ncbi:MAG: transcriptional regulator, partial [Pseudomonadota bacterium]